MSSPGIMPGRRTDPLLSNESSAGECIIQGSDPVLEILREQCELAITRQIRGLDQLQKKHSSDFQLSSDKVTFSLYSQWITNGSPYLERMIKNVTGPPNARSLTINEFCQDTVIRMITYCYTGDYIDVSISDYARRNSLTHLAAHVSVLRKKFTDGLRLQRIVEESGEIQDKLKANIQVLALAQKYEFDSLFTLATTRLERLRNAPSFPEDLCKNINDLVDSPASSLLLGAPLAKLCLPFVSKLKRNTSFLKAMAKSGEFLTHLWVLDEDTNSVEICGASATVNGVGQEWKTRYFLKRVGDQNVLVAKTPQQNGRYEFSGEIPTSSDQPLDKFAQELKVKNNIRTLERPIYKSPAKKLMGT